MGQISFKISDEDIEFLKWYSAETSESMSSIYRNVTLNHYKEWKLSILLTKYASGEIGFKKMCDLGKISLTEGMLLLEKNKIEPPITKLMDDYTSKVADEIIESLNTNK